MIDDDARVAAVVTTSPSTRRTRRSGSSPTLRRITSPAAARRPRSRAGSRSSPSVVRYYPASQRSDFGNSIVLGMGGRLLRSVCMRRAVTHPLHIAQLDAHGLIRASRGVGARWPNPCRTRAGMSSHTQSPTPLSHAIANLDDLRSSRRATITRTEAARPRTRQADPRQGLRRSRHPLPAPRSLRPPDGNSAPPSRRRRHLPVRDPPRASATEAPSDQARLRDEVTGRRLASSPSLTH